MGERGCSSCIKGLNALKIRMYCRQLSASKHNISLSITFIVGLDLLNFVEIIRLIVVIEIDCFAIVELGEFLIVSIVNFGLWIAAVSHGFVLVLSGVSGIWIDMYGIGSIGEYLVRVKIHLNEQEINWVNVSEIYSIRSETHLELLLFWSLNVCLFWLIDPFGFNIYLSN